MTVRLTHLPETEHESLPAVFEQLAAIDAAAMTAIHGNDDLTDPAEVFLRRHLQNSDTRHVVVVATDESDRVLGYLQADLPLRDNTHLVETYAAVHPDHQGRGVGTALAAEADRVAAAAGRRTLTAWTAHSGEADPDDTDALAAPTGAGRLRADDPATRLALAHGYRLEQTERHSVLEVPVPARVLDPLRQQAADGSGGYELLTWTGSTPEEHVEGMAALHRRMSVDVPHGELSFEEEEWDADRVRRQDREQADLGRTLLTAAARHRDSGELVAFTQMSCPKQRPELCYQWSTLVHGDHRGHRLGLLVKVANLDQLRQSHPQLRRIHTWNAGENQWMLAINVALGFRPASLEGAWQKKLA